MIEKLVLIDSSGMLEGRTPLLELYRDATMETNPVLKYKKVQNVFEEIPDAGHASFVEKTAIVYEMLLTFLKKMTVNSDIHWLIERQPSELILMSLLISSNLFHCLLFYR